MTCLLRCWRWLGVYISEFLGLTFKARLDELAWKQAVHEQDSDSFDWIENKAK